MVENSRAKLEKKNLDMICANNLKVVQGLLGGAGGDQDVFSRQVMGRNFSHQVEHIALANRTDLVLIAPATANVCGKLAHGLADDMLTTTVLACTCRTGSP